MPVQHTKYCEVDCKKKHHLNWDRNPVKETITISPEVLETIGLYLAEGCVSVQTRGIQTRFCFGKAIKEYSYAHLVEKTLQVDFGVRTLHWIMESTNVIDISSRSLGRFFSLFGKNSKEKRLPPWAILLPEEQIRWVLKGMFEGDGNHSYYAFNYSSSSFSMVSQLRLILFKLGILNGVKIVKAYPSNINGRVIKSRTPNYVVTISGDAARRFARLIESDHDGGQRTSGNFGFVTEKQCLIPIRKIGLSNYHGPVYNLEVESDESYTTLWGVVHNCSYKHLGSAKIKLQEAMASEGKRLQEKVTDAWDQLNEVETTHLTRWPELIPKLREMRKRLEPSVFTATPPDPKLLGEIEAFRKEVLLYEGEEQGHEHAHGAVVQESDEKSLNLPINSILT